MKPQACLTLTAFLILSSATPSPAQSPPTTDDDGLVTLKRADAEACLAAVPKAKRFDELAKANDDLAKKCRKTEADWLFANGQLAESQRVGEANGARIEDQAATIALQRRELDARWSPLTWVAIGAAAAVLTRVVVGLAVPSAGYF